MTKVAVQIKGMMSLAADFEIGLKGIVRSDSAAAIGIAYRKRHWWKVQAHGVLSSMRIILQLHRFRVGPKHSTNNFFFFFFFKFLFLFFFEKIF